MMGETDRAKVKTTFEEWFRSLGVEKRVGRAPFTLAPPPMTLLRGLAADELLLVQPAGLTAAELSDLFNLSNWAAAGLETVSQATVGADRWFTTSASELPPYLGESPESVLKVAADAGKRGMTLEQYMIFAARFRSVNNRCPDMNYWSWLLESQERSLFLFAGFDSHGNLQINSCTADYRDDNIGCRLVTLE
jgi:hypothetical protein